ncbi:GyrI-like domain-containing protein [Ideonella sp. 4Y11]|uniref:GyrI-like domain-containing protein n=1 Tax=Ideonella aquatica TaxID=2824119 RepID=A0A940YDX6_9BURK|nr:GyrI-like domain-containing protein [Ideonella aquatica]MBQ0958413.1 GyrI-like domain-containing protein [Ideonella aquatica]
MNGPRLIRFAELPAGLAALTATARGMEEGRFSRASAEAFGELARATRLAGHIREVRNCISISPDVPSGPDDADCRFVAGYLFGHDLRTGQGAGERPAVAMHGSLAWWPLASGRYAVFGHQGPHDTLAQAWREVFDTALPAMGLQARAAPLDLMVDDRRDTPAQALRTEIWVPV